MSQDIQAVLKEYSFWKKRVIALHGDIEELKRGIRQVASPAISHMDASGINGSGNIQQSQVEFLTLHKEQMQLELQKKEIHLMRLEHSINSIERAIDVLPKTDKEIIYRRYIDGMTWENTAMLVQASIGFCRKHASKALEHLAHVYFL